MPMIESVEEYGDQWVKWWTAAQPEWRRAEGWPFPRDDDTDVGDWGQLFAGGKDGLFIVVMSLSWWAHTRDPDVDSGIDDAVHDVSWVIKHLITSLSTAHDPLPVTPPPQTKHSKPPKPPKSIKIGPPRKRARR